MLYNNYMSWVYILTCFAKTVYINCQLKNVLYTNKKLKSIICTQSLPIYYGKTIHFPLTVTSAFEKQGLHLYVFFGHYYFQMKIIKNYGYHFKVESNGMVQQTWPQVYSIYPEQPVTATFIYKDCLYMIKSIYLWCFDAINLSEIKFGPVVAKSVFSFLNHPQVVGKPIVTILVIPSNSYYKELFLVCSGIDENQKIDIFYSNTSVLLPFSYHFIDDQSDDAFISRKYFSGAAIISKEEQNGNSNEIKYQGVVFKRNLFHYFSLLWNYSDTYQLNFFNYGFYFINQFCDCPVSFCLDPYIEAIDIINESQVYIFRDKYYWKFSSNLKYQISITNVKPLVISDDFLIKGISYIDAMATCLSKSVDDKKESYYSFIFVDDRYFVLNIQTDAYTYDSFRIYKHFQIERVDSAFCDRFNNLLYLFSSNKFHVYSIKMMSKQIVNQMKKKLKKEATSEQILLAIIKNDVDSEKLNRINDENVRVDGASFDYRFMNDEQNKTNILLFQGFFMKNVSNIFNLNSSRDQLSTQKIFNCQLFDYKHTFGSKHSFIKFRSFEKMNSKLWNLKISLKPSKESELKKVDQTELKYIIYKWQIAVVAFLTLVTLFVSSLIVKDSIFFGKGASWQKYEKPANE